MRQYPFEELLQRIALYGGMPNCASIRRLVAYRFHCFQWICRMRR